MSAPIPSPTAPHRLAALSMPTTPPRLRTTRPDPAIRLARDASRLIAHLLLLAVAMVGVSLPLRAQATAEGTVQGVVTNAMTAQPVAGARVSAPGATGGVREAVTDDRGAYRLTGVALGRQPVTVRAIGYDEMVQTVPVTAGESFVALFRLSRPANVLNEVVVTGTVAATERRALPNAVTVITAQDIERRAVVQVQDLFRGDIPGLFAAEVGAGTSTSIASQVAIYSRGATNLSRTPSPPKVFIDYVEVTDVTALYTLDPRSIERIEVLPGPQASTIYGSGAINGVVQVFLKKGDPSVRRPRATLTASGGTIQNSFDDRIVAQQDHALSVQGAAGANATFDLGASYRTVGEWVPGRTDDRRTVTGGIRLAVGKLTANISARYGTGTIDGFSFPAQEQAIRAGELPFEPSQVGVWRQSRDVVHQTFGLTTAYEATSWWQHRVTLGREVQNSVGEVPGRFLRLSLADTTRTSSSFNRTSSTLQYVTTATAPAIGPARATLTAGIDYTEGTTEQTGGRQRISGGPFTASQYSRSSGLTKGYFAQSMVALWDAVYLTAGLRAEDNPNYGPDYGINYAPRFGVSAVRDVGEVTAKVRAAYGRATNPPFDRARFDDLVVSSLFGVTYAQVVGNTSIRPEHQRGGEVGLDLAFGGRASLALTHFDQTADDLITQIVLPDVVLDVPGFTQPFRYTPSTTVNLGRVRTRGWELQAGALFGPVEVIGTFATQTGRVERIDESDLYRPYRVGDIIQGPARQTGSLLATYTRDRLTGGVRVSHIGPVFQLFNRAQEQTSGARDAGASPRAFYPYAANFQPGYQTNGYRTADVNAAYAVRDGLNVFLNVYNLGDYYRSDQTNIAVTQGRRTLAGVRMTF